jgi:hypothetical protein
MPSNGGKGKSRAGGYLHKCEVCGKSFMGRKDALTCSPAHRVKKSRDIKSGLGKNWYAVRDVYKSAFTELSHQLSQETLKPIVDLLYMHGAAVAEYAIAAVVDAVNEVNAKNERRRAS